MLRAFAGGEAAEGEGESVEGKKRDRGVGPVSADVEPSKWRRLVVRVAASHVSPHPGEGSSGPQVESWMGQAGS